MSKRKRRWYEFWKDQEWKDPRCGQKILWDRSTGRTYPDLDRDPIVCIYPPNWKRKKKVPWYQIGQWVATAVAIAGVLLNNARRRECFVLWSVSNSITLYYHIRGRLWGLAARDAVFLVLAAVGWVMWGRN